ncbi:MAG: lysoplasmalogenase [Clostridiales bacterium]|nr:lysoplasmalogenase [Clostridiales bacterium]
MEKTVYLILIAAAVVIEAIFTPLFLKAQRPGANLKSMTYKMICATMFFMVGAFSVLYAGNRSGFAAFMIAGLALSWLGDFFLHIPRKAWCFGIGFAFFTLAHVMYITAYSLATKAYFPDRKIINIYEIIAVILIEIGLYIFYKFKKKMSFKSAGMIASAFYGIVLNTMTVKAVSFSAQYIYSMLTPKAVFGGLCIALGGICFFTSDTSLVILMFNKPDKHNHKLKNHNIGTYFFGQTLLALSILFVGC